MKNESNFEKRQRMLANDYRDMPAAVLDYYDCEVEVILFDGYLHDVAIGGVYCVELLNPRVLDTLEELAQQAMERIDDAETRGCDRYHARKDEL